MSKFGFNLIPQKPQEIVEKEETRDKASVYSALLPLVGVVLWLIIVVFNGSVVAGVKNNWQSAVEDKQGRIAGEFFSIRLLHGEYVIKTVALANLIQKDVKPESVFLLTEALFPGEQFDQDVQITGYARNSDGSFEVTMRAKSYEQFSEITRRFVNIPGTDNVRVNSVAYIAESGEVQGGINFFLDVNQLTDAGS